jgi:hypothetical protein
MDPTEMTDNELQAAQEAASAACMAAWQTWEVARDAGATLHSPEWKAHGEAQKTLLDPVSREIHRRVTEANMRRIAHLIREPLSGPAWDEAWLRGPGQPDRDL